VGQRAGVDCRWPIIRGLRWCLHVPVSALRSVMP
jgi:hypothetical protein